MSRERLKSFVLAVLVMINFILGAKILNDKKLWPYGYNFFSFVENSDLYKAIKNKNKSITKTHITMPRQIFVNTGDQTSRISIRSDNENFGRVFAAAADLLVSALKEHNVRPAKQEEWVSALSGKSVCLSYAVEYDTKLFGEFFAVDSSAVSTSVPSFSRIIISTDKSVFFEEFKTGKFYTVTAKASSDELTEIIKSLKNSSESKSVINYSVDLKFNETLGSQTITLSGAAPVYSAPLAFERIYAENPLLNIDGTFDDEKINDIISLFRINSNTVRRYSEADGTLVCVENNCILKIHPSGILSYQSTNGSGLSLTADNSYVDAVTALADFTDKLTAAAEAEQDLYISKPLSEKNASVTFDYRSCGIPVSISVGKSKNAVSAEIKNGSVISYSQVFRRYTKTGVTEEMTPFISVLDDTAEKYSQESHSMEISEIYPAFNDDGGQNYITADWIAKIKDIEIKEEEIG